MAFELHHEEGGAFPQEKKGKRISVIEESVGTQKISEQGSHNTFLMSKKLLAKIKGNIYSLKISIAVLFIKGNWK